jgi:membrane protease YdiL (CAAX protease family)
MNFSLQLMHYPIADIIFTLYLLVYYPVDGILRSLYKKSPKPKLSTLQGYWRQGRFILILLAVFMLVSWFGDHSADELGLGLPPSTAGIWGLAIVVGLLVTLHILGKRAEAKLTAEERLKQEEKIRELPFSMPQTRQEIVIYFVTMIGMTATWELFFRGYLLLVLTPITGLPLAVVLAAVSYGAGHGFVNIKQFLGSIVAAFAFTIGYAFTGSLWWLIVLHAAAPTAMFFAARKLSQGRSIDAATV